MTKNVLFVCMGNMCRSPIAEHLFKKIIRDHKRGDQIRVRSAGISPGIALSKNAETVILEQCGTNDFMGPRGIEQQKGAQLDYVFVMEQNHLDRVRKVLGGSAAEIITLKAAAGLSGDIGDSYGQDVDAYKETANEIEDCLDKILKQFASSFRRNSESTY